MDKSTAKKRRPFRLIYIEREWYRNVHMEKPYADLTVYVPGVPLLTVSRLLR